MPDSTCSSCGQAFLADGDRAVCPECSAASAIATAADARKAKVNPVSASDGLLIQSLHTPERGPLSPADDEPTPSIAREYHYSFLRLCVYYLLLAAAFIACFAWWGFGP